MEPNEHRRLRHVVIGAGAGIFKLHQDGLALPTTELVGVADVNPAARERLEAETGAPFYTDHKRMLAELKPDVAVVITPHPFHAPLSIDCLDAGCHVLVEKPLAVQVAEADAMLAAAQKADRLLAVNFQQRLRPEAVALRKLLDTGRLGDIQHVEMSATWTRTALYFQNAGWRGTWLGEGGGVLMNQSPHNMDLLCYLVGLPQRVVAWTRTLIHNIETEDTVQAMLEWANGATGSFHVSTSQAGKPFWFEIIGTKGIVQWSQKGVEFRSFEPDVRTHIAESDQMYASPNVHAELVELPESSGTHLFIYRNLHDAILNGAPLVAPGHEAAQSLELANAMILSSHMGKQVELPLARAEYADLLARLRRE